MSTWRFWRKEFWAPEPAERRAVTFQDFWGQGRDAPGIRGDTIDTAATLIPVFSATRLIADSIATLPIHAYREVDGRGVPIAKPALLRDPTIFGEQVDWVHRAVVSMLYRGNAYGYVTVWTADAFPRQVEWFHPDDIQVVDNTAIARPQWTWQHRPVDRDSFIHIPGYTLPGRVLGLSPIQKFKLDIETGLRARGYGRDWFTNGSIPAGVLEADGTVTESQADTIKARFKKAAAGRSPVVLGAGAKYRPIAVTPEESQFLETIRANATDIANIYGIPPELIGGEAPHSNTYQNVEQRTTVLQTFALRPYLVRLEQHLSRLLPRPQYVKFNADAVVRVDLKTRYGAHHLALEDGWKSKDEVRELEELPPLPNGQGAGYGPQLPAVPDPSARPDPARRLRAISGDD